jgi:hypothetical protein
VEVLLEVERTSPQQFCLWITDHVEKEQLCLAISETIFSKLEEEGNSNCLVN